MKAKKFIQKFQKREIKNIVMMISIIALVLPILAFSNNNAPAFKRSTLAVKNEVNLKTGDVFDLDLLFGEEVNDTYFDVIFEKEDEPSKTLEFEKKYYNKKGKEVSEKTATYAKKLKYGYTVKKIVNSTGKYKVHIRNINSDAIYNTIINITDGKGPQLVTNEDIAINPHDFIAINDFVASCSDESSHCDYRIIDENGNEVKEFSKEEGMHTYTLQANDALGNVTTKTINYEINNNLAPDGMRIYRSASGFESDNPIVRDALSYVGRSGLNCEQLFQLVMRNNQELNAKTGGDINSVRTQVDLVDIQPGDELRYVDGGWGMIHVAIYLGDGLAVHGGFHGTDVVIFDAFPAGSTVPTVYHYNLD